MTDRVLLIGGDEPVPRTAYGSLGRSSVEVTSARTAAAGLELFERLHPDLVILDHRLPDGSALSLLERLVARGAAVILLAGTGDLETPVRALQLGAKYALNEPVNPVHLTAAAARVWETVGLRRDNDRLRSPERWLGALDALGVSPELRDWARQLRLAADERTPLLLTGERGTGRRAVAWLVHELGARPRAPYVEIRCAELSAAWRETDLHPEAGATIFFDEIGDLSLEAQRRLLQLLEGQPTRPADARIISATSRDLPAAVQRGHFEAALYRRLSERILKLPRAGPPRDAVEDVERTPPAPLSEVERQHIERALRFHGGNRTHAAADLGISRATLINKIKAYALNL